METSPKVQQFLWKWMNDWLLVAYNLTHTHLSKDSSCLRCQVGVETMNHLLFDCTFARLVWALSDIPVPLECEVSQSLHTNLFWLLKDILTSHGEASDLVKLAPWILWWFWKNVNCLLYKGFEFDAQQLLQKAAEDCIEWTKREVEKEKVGKEEGDAGAWVTSGDKHVENWIPPP